MDNSSDQRGDPALAGLGLVAIAGLIAVASGWGPGGCFAASAVALAVWAILAWRKGVREPLSLMTLGLFACLVIWVMTPQIVSRPTGRREACANHLKNLGICLRAYAQSHGALPPLCTIDESGRSLHSWRTLILPEMERSDILARMKLTEPWNSAQNRAAAQSPLEMYQCLSDLGALESPPDTSYVAIVGSGTAWTAGKGLRLDEIKDGPADTILLIELKDSGIKWAEPRDLDLDHLPSGITMDNLLGSLSNHAGGFHAVFADGHVEFIRADIPWSDFMAMLTIAGGEQVNRGKW